MSLEDDIWIAAKDMAVNRSRIHRFTSAVSSKFRKLKKPGNIAKTAASVTGAFIPVPFLSLGTDWVVQKAEGKIRDYTRARKLDSDDPVKSVKHGIKNLDISSLDRARFKVNHLINQLNKDLRSGKPSLTRCVGAFSIAYRFHRA